MRRFVVVCGIGLAACLSAAPAARCQTPEQVRTAAFVAELQDPDGGFPNRAGLPSSLGSTSGAIRTLGHVGGSVKDVPAATAYVLSCRDPVTGGFTPAPKGKPDARSTAVGLMAVAELRVKDAALVDKAVDYLTHAVNPKEFEEIRIAVAGLEAAKKPAPEGWARAVEATRNAEGTFGEGDNAPRATGSAVVALLRMNADIGPRSKIVEVLTSGQRPDGGWGKADEPSELDTTYRIMRCFKILGERPDLEKLRGFIARCRKSDGGYAANPELTSDVSGTYMATIILRWSRELEGNPAVVETAGFTPLFDGKTLDGWEGDTDVWSARDGMIVGKTAEGLKHNDFLATKGTYGDFVLKVSFRLLGSEASNSGVQFRSVRVPGHEMSGYQADIGRGWYGKLYDESRRNKVLDEGDPKAAASVREKGWNHYVIRATGNHIETSLNGHRSVDYHEADDAIARDGRIALQVHAGGPLEVQFKDLLIQPLATPDVSDATTPGFHLRTVKAPGGDRKYTVFVPKGYDGSKPVPTVLFLHGSGERGDDGVRPAQVGLGAILHQHPDDFPALAVFPQARETWKDGSDDARAALAALDDVAEDFKVDADRVILTGISMGGSGSWSIGAAHPGRFAAVVPVCGSGTFGKDDRPFEGVDRLKGVPVWTVLGDADFDGIVDGNRALVLALRAAGGSPRSVEYRGVGHNSWDRAYSDPSLVEWMLTQARKANP